MCEGGKTRACTPYPTAPSTAKVVTRPCASKSTRNLVSYSILSHPPSRSHHHYTFLPFFSFCPSPSSLPPFLPQHQGLILVARFDLPKGYRMVPLLYLLPPLPSFQLLDLPPPPLRCCRTVLLLSLYPPPPTLCLHTLANDVSCASFIWKVYWGKRTRCPYLHKEGEFMSSLM